MRLLATHLGGSRLLLPTHQIRQIHGWPPPSGLRVVELASVLGLQELAAPDAPQGPARVLCCATPEGELGLRTQATLVETELSGSALLALPRLLKRLAPPCWLAGLAHLDGSLALVVDLERLADGLLQRPPALPAAAERTMG